MPLPTLSRSMLNRLTLPHLREIADQMGVTYDNLSEKDWIVSDILSAQEQPIQMTVVHDALLKLERSTEDPAIVSARQFVKEYCFTATHARTTLE